MTENNIFPLISDDSYLLLEQKTIFGRTLICWYNETEKKAHLGFFSQEQPNETSKILSKTIWGYPTFFIQDISTIKEASEVVSLYLKDMEQRNFWWEKDD